MITAFLIDALMLVQDSILSTLQDGALLVWAVLKELLVAESAIIESTI